MEPIIVCGELYHHGIKNQKWGVKNGPPYPLRPGMHSVNEMRGAKKSVGTLSAYFKDKKAKKQRAAALEKARMARQANLKKAEEERKHNEEREKALRSGDAAEILKYKGEVSAEEIQRALNRIDMERKLSSYAQQDVKTAADKVDDVMKKVDKAVDWAQKGIKFYNVVSKVVNAYNEEDILPPILDPSEKWNYKKNREDFKQKVMDTTKKEEELRRLKDQSDIIKENLKQEREQTKQEQEKTKAMQNADTNWDWAAYSKKAGGVGDSNNNQKNGKNKNKNKNNGNNVQKGQPNNQNPQIKKVEDSAKETKKITQKDTTSNNKSDSSKKTSSGLSKEDENRWNSILKNKNRHGANDLFSKELYNYNDRDMQEVEKVFREELKRDMDRFPRASMKDHYSTAAFKASIKKREIEREYRDKYAEDISSKYRKVYDNWSRTREEANKYANDRAYEEISDLNKILLEKNRKKLK